MIFYFTGTGNSGYIASEIAKDTNDEIVSIAKLINENNDIIITLKDGENIGFVFPTYAWSPPRMVVEFIKKAKFNNVKNNYVYAVATCGANVGSTINIIKKSLEIKGLSLQLGYSIAMPNNYIIVGDVDNKVDEEKKLISAKNIEEEIVNKINNKEKSVYKVTKGFMGGVLSRVVSPMFNKHAMDASKFYVEDNCTGCGLCERICNCKTIKLVDNKPTWGNECSQCLACIHNCPVKAIQYGKSTKAKGRYKNPYFKLK